MLLQYKVMLAVTLRTRQQIIFKDSFFKTIVPSMIFIGLLLLVGVSQIHQERAMGQIVESYSQIPIATNFSTYENSTFGIKFQFPSNWTKVEVLSDRINDIQFTPYQNGVSDKPIAAIDISIIKYLPNMTSLDQYTKIGDKFFSKISGVSNITKSSAILAGIPANERVFILNLQAAKAELGIKQVFTLKDNKAYIITYTAQLSKYFDYLPMVQHMVNSFQIK